MIPVIDFSESESAVAEQIYSAYSQTGFAYLANHGIRQSLLDDIFAASAEFHALPIEQKMAIELNHWHRGYIPINSSTTITSSVAQVEKPNQSESLMVMHELAEDNPERLAGMDLAGPNQWPATLPHLKPIVQNYVAEITSLCQQLTRAIECALHAPADSIQRHFNKPVTFLRLLHYPPQPSVAAENAFGSAPHTDYGFITLLAQDCQSGLQVRSPRGEWLDVPPKPGTFVMNAGDMLQRISNGKFISTPHRVINNNTGARYSIPFFFDPHMSTMVMPLDCCVDDGAKPLYNPVIYGDYLMTRLHSNHRQHN